MSITSAIVLYAMLWFGTFLTILPIGLKTQGDVGDVMEGTHASAPHEHGLKKKAWITTAIAAVIWLVLFVIITQEIITVRDFDVRGLMDR